MVKTSTSISMGIIGLGPWGQLWIQKCLQHPSISLVMICDRNASKLASAIVPKSKKTTLPEEVFQDPAIQLVIITTQINSHFDLMKRALLNRKHVLVTKPVLLKIEELKEIEDLAKKVDRKVFVDHTFLFHSKFESILNFVKKQGPAQAYASNRSQFGRYQPQSNVLWELMYHDIYMVLHLFSGEVASVSATGHGYSFPGIIETASLTIKWEDNRQAYCYASFCGLSKQRLVSIQGASYLLEWNEMADRPLIQGAFKLNSQEGRIQHQLSDSQPIDFASHDAILRQLDHCLHCLGSGATPINGLEASRLTSTIILAALNSIAHFGQEIDL